MSGRLFANLNLSQRWCKICGMFIANPIPYIIPLKYPEITVIYTEGSLPNIEI